MLLVAVGGWLLRAAPLLYFGPAASATGYDDGVYFTAVMSFARGSRPYRDFVYTHPPGFLALWSPFAFLATRADPAAAFAAMRWATTFVGAVNIVLLGRLATRSFGFAPGIAAAILYAVSPYTVLGERGPLLEPTLNLACLSLATVWLNEDEARPILRASVAGILLAAAITIKAWGVLWIVPCVVTIPPSFRAAQLRVFLAAALTACLAIFSVALTSPGAFWSQTVLFHVARPEDGASRAQRLGYLLSVRPSELLFNASALGGLVLVLLHSRRGASRPERFFAAVWMSIVTLFAFSQTFFEHYLAHLLIPSAMLGGIAIAALLRSLRSASLRRLAVAALTSATAYTTARVLFVPAHAPWMPQIGRAVRDIVPPDASIMAFEPAWAIAGGRLPSVMADPYSEMIDAAVRSGARSRDVTALLHSDSAQIALRSALSRADFVIVGPRGRWESSTETLAWIEAHYARRFPSGNDEGLDLWQRLPVLR